MKTKLIALFFVALIGCSKNNPAPDLSGHWKISSPSISGNVGIKKGNVSQGEYFIYNSTDPTKNININGVGIITSISTGSVYYGNCPTCTNKFGGVSIYGISDKKTFVHFENFNGTISNDLKTITITEFRVTAQCDPFYCFPCIGCWPVDNVLKETLTMTRVN